jgi:hypothetical protein
LAGLSWETFGFVSTIEWQSACQLALSGKTFVDSAVYQFVRDTVRKRREGEVISSYTAEPAIAVVRTISAMSARKDDV